MRSPESGVRFSLKTHENHVVRPAGIEPATLSLEVGSEISLGHEFKEMAVQDAAKSVRSIPFHAPPAHHGFALPTPELA